MFVGLDMGIKALKMVLTEDGRVLGRRAAEYGAVETGRLVDSWLDELCREAGRKPGDLTGAAATGLKMDLPAWVDRQVIEPICLVNWADKIDPGIKTILDIGYHKITVTTADRGRVANTATSDRCAAGAGVFLQTVLNLLEMDIEALDRLTLSPEEAIPVNNTCAVFAESEIISKLYQGCSPQGLLAGVINGLAGRIHSLILKSGIRGRLAVVGGYASIKPLIEALEINLGDRITVPPQPRYAAAWGAALEAEARTGGEEAG